MDNSTIDIGQRRELFVDALLIERLEQARRVLHRPQPREIAIACDAPWEGEAPGYATVLRDGDTYRMYYRAFPYGIGPDSDETQATCYAESADGLHWTKPELGLIEFAGSKNNNMLWQGVIAHNFTPFLDANPAASPKQRYKAVGGVGFGLGGLWGLTSPDGIHWQTMGDQPLSLEGNFDSQNLVFWDAERGFYRAYWRAHRNDDPKVPDGRDVRTATRPTIPPATTTSSTPIMPCPTRGPRIWSSPFPRATATAAGPRPPMPCPTVRSGGPWPIWT